MNCRVILSALTLAAVLPLSLQALAKMNPPTADEKLDKKAVEIVKKAGALYKDAKSIHAEAILSTKSSGQGDGPEVKLSAVYDIERPLSVSLRTKLDGDDKKGADLVADGKKIYVFRKALKQYAENDCPKAMGDIGMSLLQLGPASGILFGNILAADPAQQLMDGVTSCSYVGLDKVDGTPAHRMRFSQQDFDWELWVASEGKPYVLRMINMRDGPNGKVTTTETYKNWKLDGTITKETFTFKAPEGGTKVEEFGQPASK